MPCVLENKICESSSTKSIGNNTNFIDIPKTYLDLFPFELSNFQKFAIQAILQGHHSLTCVPTGSGKTVPALFAIQYFTQNNQRVIYTSPIKALSNQKYKEFSEKFPNLSFGIVTGDIKINLNAQVLIMTAEILQYKLLNKDRNTDFDIDFEKVGCIIHDEVHMINDSNRGHVWENCISACPLHIQMILLSATLADPYKFATWIENSHPTKKVYISNVKERAVPLIHYSYFTIPKFLKKFIEKNASLRSELEEHADELILLKDAEVIQTDNYFRMKKIRLLQNKHNCKINQIHIIKSVVEKLAKEDLLPAVCFILSKSRMEKIVSNFDVDILEFDSKLPYTIDKQCESILRQKFSNYKEFLLLPEFENLMKLLRKGVAVHHASMTPIFRELVEILFEKGYIKLLFATETFSVGLNMPIKTTIFTDIFKYDGINHRLLQPQEFTQASGRAGRRGIDVKGNVIHLFNLYPNYEDAEFFRMLRGEPPTMYSKFKLSWDLVLKNDFIFFEKLLYSKELENLILETEEDYKQKILRYQNSLLKTTTTPVEIQEQYESLARKKSKKKHFKMSQLREEYPMLIEDLESKEKIQFEQMVLSNSKIYLDEIKNGFHSNVSKMRKELEFHGFLKNNKITLLGESVLFLKEVPSLVFLKMLPTFENFNVCETLIFLSCFTNIRVQEEKIIYKKNLNITNELKDILRDMENICESFLRFEGNNNLFTGENYDYHYNLVNPIQEWITCQDENECVSFLNRLKAESSISCGDFTKAILKISNTASQLEQIAEKNQKFDWLQNLKQIPKMILKFIATNQSLYV